MTSLKVLLAREKDEDAPRLSVLLTESLIAVYMSLLISALSMYDSQMLYRLVANKLDAHTWGALFGGGNKTAVRSEKTALPSKLHMLHEVDPPLNTIQILQN